VDENVTNCGKGFDISAVHRVEELIKVVIEMRYGRIA